ncbi:hypothetical protein Pmani_014487 [Petrolisthes manimaculis]|uniref:Uncharacterized protein n=1 Tax=Petrolisthes manimaculis TaxID=1843537 RepID=A0AAE1PSS3_9EUCA|nr:hypothetical protein Pmani_014487 [Petrolisthes manimaculis]
MGGKSKWRKRRGGTTSPPSSFTRRGGKKNAPDQSEDKQEEGGKQGEHGKVREGGGGGAGARGRVGAEAEDGGGAVGGEAAGGGAVGGEAGEGGGGGKEGGKGGEAGGGEGGEARGGGAAVGGGGGGKEGGTEKSGTKPMKLNEGGAKMKKELKKETDGKVKDGMDKDGMDKDGMDKREATTAAKEEDKERSQEMERVGGWKENRRSKRRKRKKAVSEDREQPDEEDGTPTTKGHERKEGEGGKRVMEKTGRGDERREDSITEDRNKMEKGVECREGLEEQMEKEDERRNACRKDERKEKDNENKEGVKIDRDNRMKEKDMTEEVREEAKVEIPSEIHVETQGEIREEEARGCKEEENNVEEKLREAREEEEKEKEEKEKEDKTQESEKIREELNKNKEKTEKWTRRSETEEEKWKISKMEEDLKEATKELDENEVEEERKDTEIRSREEEEEEEEVEEERSVIYISSDNNSDTDAVFLDLADTITDTTKIDTMSGYNTDDTADTKTEIMADTLTNTATRTDSDTPPDITNITFGDQLPEVMLDTDVDMVDDVTTGTRVDSTTHIFQYTKYDTRSDTMDNLSPVHFNTGEWPPLPQPSASSSMSAFATCDDRTSTCGMDINTKTSISENDEDTKTKTTEYSPENRRKVSTSEYDTDNETPRAKESDEELKESVGHLNIDTRNSVSDLDGEIKTPSSDYDVDTLGRVSSSEYDTETRTSTNEYDTDTKTSASEFDADTLSRLSTDEHDADTITSTSEFDTDTLSKVSISKYDANIRRSVSESTSIGETLTTPSSISISTSEDKVDEEEEKDRKKDQPNNKGKIEKKLKVEKDGSDDFEDVEVKEGEAPEDETMSEGEMGVEGEMETEGDAASVFFSLYPEYQPGDDEGDAEAWTENRSGGGGDRNLTFRCFRDSGTTAGGWPSEVIHTLAQDYSGEGRVHAKLGTSDADEGREGGGEGRRARGRGKRQGGARKKLGTIEGKTEEVTNSEVVTRGSSSLPKVVAPTPPSPAPASPAPSSPAPSSPAPSSPTPASPTPATFTSSTVQEEQCTSLQDHVVPSTGGPLKSSDTTLVGRARQWLRGVAGRTWSQPQANPDHDKMDEAEVSKGDGTEANVQGTAEAEGSEEEFVDAEGSQFLSGTPSKPNTSLERTHTPMDKSSEIRHTPVDKTHSPGDRASTPLDTPHLPVDKTHTPLDTEHTRTDTPLDISFTGPDVPNTSLETQQKCDAWKCSLPDVSSSGHSQEVTKEDKALQEDDREEEGEYQEYKAENRGDWEGIEWKEGVEFLRYVEKDDDGEEGDEDKEKKKRSGQKQKEEYITTEEKERRESKGRDKEHNEQEGRIKRRERKDSKEEKNGKDEKKARAGGRRRRHRRRTVSVEEEKGKGSCIGGIMKEENYSNEQIEAGSGDYTVARNDEEREDEKNVIKHEEVEGRMRDRKESDKTERACKDEKQRRGEESEEWETGRKEGEKRRWESKGGRKDNQEKMHAEIMGETEVEGRTERERHLERERESEEQREKRHIDKERERDERREKRQEEKEREREERRERRRVEKEKEREERREKQYSEKEREERRESKHSERREEERREKRGERRKKKDSESEREERRRHNGEKKTSRREKKRTEEKREREDRGERQRENSENTDNREVKREEEESQRRRTEENKGDGMAQERMTEERQTEEEELQEEQTSTKEEEDQHEEEMEHKLKAEMWNKEEHDNDVCKGGDKEHESKKVTEKRADGEPSDWKGILLEFPPGYNSPPPPSYDRWTCPQGIKDTQANQHLRGDPSQRSAVLGLQNFEPVYPSIEAPMKLKYPEALAQPLSPPWSPAAKALTQDRGYKTIGRQQLALDDVEEKDCIKELPAKSENRVCSRRERTQSPLIFAFSMMEQSQKIANGATDVYKEEEEVSGGDECLAQVKKISQLESLEEVPSPTFCTRSFPLPLLSPVRPLSPLRTLIYPGSCEPPSPDPRDLAWPANMLSIQKSIDSRPCQENAKQISGTECEPVSSATLSTPGLVTGRPHTPMKVLIYPDISDPPHTLDPRYLAWPACLPSNQETEHPGRLQDPSYTPTLSEGCTSMPEDISQMSETSESESKTPSTPRPFTPAPLTPVQPLSPLKTLTFPHDISEPSSPDHRDLAWPACLHLSHNSKYQGSEDTPITSSQGFFKEEEVQASIDDLIAKDGKEYCEMFGENLKESEFISESSELLSTHLDSRSYTPPMLIPAKLQSPLTTLSFPDNISEPSSPNPKLLAWPACLSSHQVSQYSHVQKSDNINSGILLLKHKSPLSNDLRIIGREETEYYEGDNKQISGIVCPGEDDIQIIEELNRVSIDSDSSSGSFELESPLLSISEPFQPPSLTPARSLSPLKMLLYPGRSEPPSPDPRDLAWPACLQYKQVLDETNITRTTINTGHFTSPTLRDLSSRTLKGDSSIHQTDTDQENVNKNIVWEDIANVPKHSKENRFEFPSPVKDFESAKEKNYVVEIICGQSLDIGKSKLVSFPADFSTGVKSEGKEYDGKDRMLEMKYDERENKMQSDNQVANQSEQSVSVIPSNNIPLPDNTEVSQLAQSDVQGPHSQVQTSDSVDTLQNKQSPYPPKVQPTPKPPIKPKPMNLKSKLWKKRSPNAKDQTENPNEQPEKKGKEAVQSTQESGVDFYDTNTYFEESPSKNIPIGMEESISEDTTSKQLHTESQPSILESTKSFQKLEEDASITEQDVCHSGIDSCNSPANNLKKSFDSKPDVIKTRPIIDYSNKDFMGFKPGHEDEELMNEELSQVVEESKLIVNETDNNNITLKPITGLGSDGNELKFPMGEMTHDRTDYRSNAEEGGLTRKNVSIPMEELEPVCEGFNINTGDNNAEGEVFRPMKEELTTKFNPEAKEFRPAIEEYAKAREENKLQQDIARIGRISVAQRIRSVETSRSSRSPEMPKKSVTFSLNTKMDSGEPAAASYPTQEMDSALLGPSSLISKVASSIPRITSPTRTRDSPNRVGSPVRVLDLPVARITSPVRGICSPKRGTSPVTKLELQNRTVSPKRKTDSITTRITSPPRQTPLPSRITSPSRKIDPPTKVMASSVKNESPPMKVTSPTRQVVSSIEKLASPTREITSVPTNFPTVRVASPSVMSSFLGKKPKPCTPTVRFTSPQRGTHKNLASPRDHLSSAPQDPLQSPWEQCTPQEQIPLTQKPISPSKELIPRVQGTTAQSQESTSQPQDQTLPSEEPLSSHLGFQEQTSTSENFTRSWKETIPSPEEIPCPREIIPSSIQPLPLPEDSSLRLEFTKSSKKSTESTKEGIISTKDPVQSPRELNISLPREPIASTSVPTIASPRQPIASPRQPIASPREPIASPRKPIASPRQPIASPREPIASPRKPIASPREPTIASPREPIASPKEFNMSSPRKSIASPMEPIASPREPTITSPMEPIASPREPTITSPMEPIASPREPIASPREPTITSPMEPIASPREPTITSPMEPIASPREPIASPRDESTPPSGFASSPKESTVFTKQATPPPSLAADLILPQIPSLCLVQDSDSSRPHQVSSCLSPPPPPQDNTQLLDESRLSSMQDPTSFFSSPHNSSLSSSHNSSFSSPQDSRLSSPQNVRLSSPEYTKPPQGAGQSPQRARQSPQGARQSPQGARQSPQGARYSPQQQGMSPHPGRKVKRRKRR